MLRATPEVIDAYIMFLVNNRPKPKVKPPCTFCGTRESSTWRPGPVGPSSLCNKCGVTYMDTGKRNRTIDLILINKKAMWVKKDNASWKWHQHREADMEDPRIINWVHRENIRNTLAMPVLKKRRL